ISLTEYITHTPNTAYEDEFISEEEERKDEKEDEEESQVETQDDVNNSEIVIKKNETKAKSNIIPFTKSEEHKETIQDGDTLVSILEKLGFNKTEVYSASKALSKVFNLKNLKVGQEVTIFGKRDSDKNLILNGIELRLDCQFKIVVSKKNDKFLANKIEIPLRKVVQNISGIISPRSPELSLRQCGVKLKIARETLRIIKQIAVARRLNSPVDFELLCKNLCDENGNIVSSPELVYISFFINNKIHRIYSFKDGKSQDYVDSNGFIINTPNKSGSALGNPLKRMKVNSKFGMRPDPFHKRIRFHAGVDFSAKSGELVYAAANGIVVKAGYHSGYGKCIMIKHSGNIETMYAHLSRISVRIGQNVHANQFIGCVGNTGRSQAPHLHFSVLKNGRFINPLSRIKIEAEKLNGKRLFRFNQFKKEVSLQIAGLVPSYKKKAEDLRRYN
ncbi:MAG: peptidoglycan DD-metalloendopeptidase family protein, partial [Holosporales bacterium]|nr:peptidoglycan DD-metalloendopeptidase family protein [Holosporales bacterium]